MLWAMTNALHEREQLQASLQLVEARVDLLADRRTLGTFQAIAGRAGVMEGMGPHIRPAVLELAIGEIFRGRAFFERPAHGLAYLRERAVAAIVSGTERGGIDDAASLTSPGDPGLLSRSG